MSRGDGIVMDDLLGTEFLATSAATAKMLGTILSVGLAVPDLDERLTEYTAPASWSSSSDATSALHASMGWRRRCGSGPGSRSSRLAPRDGHDRSPSP